MTDPSTAPDAPPPVAVSPRMIAQALRGWRTAGVTHLLRPAAEPLPIAPPAPEATAPAASPVEQPAAHDTPSPASPMPRSRSAAAPSTPAPCALSRDERQQKLDQLARQVAACTRCRELAETRTQTVFGVGNPEARVMFIGEAPGADEDRQGEPFVGRAGQLLNKIIDACGWQREDLYICNILRCRPPGNRNPSDEEAHNCREYLDGQIALVDPDYIVCWGSIAAKNLLATEQPIGRLREQWFEYKRAKVLCTYHPSYLLRNPSAKKPVWEDMQRLLKDMGLEPPSSSR